MVIINAGSSAGTEDYTYQAVANLGEVLVHGVSMMPGKPTLLGVVNVHSGTADVGLGILAAAKALGLDFIPLMPERYDLVVPESTYEDRRFQTLLEVIRSPEFKETATALGGYDLKDCGQIVWEQ